MQTSLIWWWSIDLLPKSVELPKWFERIILIIALPVIVYLIIKIFVFYLSISWLSATITTLLIVGFFAAAGKLGEKIQAQDPKPPSLSDRRIEIHTNGIKYNLFFEYSNTPNDFYSLDTILIDTIKIGTRLCNINGNWGLGYALMFKVNYMPITVKLPLIGITKKDMFELEDALDIMKKDNT